MYGNAYSFRQALEARGPAYVVAVTRPQAVSSWPPYGPIGQAKADALTADMAPGAWQRFNCRDGAQGERVYD